MLVKQRQQWLSSSEFCVQLLSCQNTTNLSRWMEKDLSVDTFDNQASKENGHYSLSDNKHHRRENKTRESTSFFFLFLFFCFFPFYEAQTASGNSGQFQSEEKTTPNSFTLGKINMTNHYILLVEPHRQGYIHKSFFCFLEVKSFESSEYRMGHLLFGKKKKTLWRLTGGSGFGRNTRTPDTVIFREEKLNTNQAVIKKCTCLLSSWIS